MGSTAAAYCTAGIVIKRANNTTITARIIFSKRPAENEEGSAHENKPWLMIRRMVIEKACKANSNVLGIIGGVSNGKAIDHTPQNIPKLTTSISNFLYCRSSIHTRIKYHPATTVIGACHASAVNEIVHGNGISPTPKAVIAIIPSPIHPYNAPTTKRVHMSRTLNCFMTINTMYANAEYASQVPMFSANVSSERHTPQNMRSEKKKNI